MKYNLTIHRLLPTQYGNLTIEQLTTIATNNKGCNLTVSPTDLPHVRYELEVFHDKTTVKRHSGAMPVMLLATYDKSELKTTIESVSQISIEVAIALLTGYIIGASYAQNVG